MKPANKIWLNGKILPLEKANFLSFHQGLNYGACIYDGIRFYKTGAGTVIFRLKEHSSRGECRLWWIDPCHSDYQKDVWCRRH